VPFARRRDRVGAERGSADSFISFISFISAINQKNAPSREPRNPFRLFRFEVRAAAPARQGK
jgi:hypothetical protein